MPESDFVSHEVSAFVYVSNAIDGDISTYSLRDDGSLAVGPRTAAAKMAMPMVAAPDGSRIYLASRAVRFSLLTFAVDRASGALTRMFECPVDESISFLSLDASGGYLFTASYVNSCVRVFKLRADGSVDPVPRDSHLDIPQAHAIRVDASNRFAYVPSLGADAVYQFRFDAAAGRLVPLAPFHVPVPARHGPRHLVVSGDNRFVHVVNEMQASVTTFSRDDATGVLEMQASVSGLAPGSELVTGAPPSITHQPSSAQAGGSGRPPGGEPLSVRAADIQATPNGRFLYISERAGRTIARFLCNTATGELTYADSIEVGERPRSFAIDPSGRYLIAAAEIDATIGVYRIGATDGALELLATYSAGKGANWVEIVSRR